jgi:predicted ABC-type ATPase
MPKASRTQPRPPVCLIVAGPNGAGKTTFAREFLPREAGILNFVNADLIAAGLSPLKPERAALAAGRLLLSEIVNTYRPMADAWAVYDNSEEQFQLVEEGP